MFTIVRYANLYEKFLKILITGATGFIGSHVVKRLVTEGHDVHAIIRPQSDTHKIVEVLADIVIWRGDLNEPETLADRISDVQPEMCIHLAWDVQTGQYQHALTNVQNLGSTLELATRLAANGCQRFIGVGTCFEYDVSAGYLSESTASSPDSLYAACKTAASVGLEKIGNDSGMQTAWARLFYQYGPFEDERRLVPAILISMMNDEMTKTTEGAQVRDFLHVEDVASAIGAVAHSDLTGVVNVGSGQPVRVREIVQKIGEITGREDLIEFGALPYRESDPMFVCANNRRLVDGAGWTPTYDLDSGLRQTADWLRRARSTPGPSTTFGPAA